MVWFISSNKIFYLFLCIVCFLSIRDYTELGATKSDVKEEEEDRDSERWKKKARGRDDHRSNALINQQQHHVQ